ncbi:MAG: flagellar hook assembly protein FlgD [bacterium]
MNLSSSDPSALMPVLGRGSPQGVNRLEGREEFLKILVAQMRYQDPLNPLSGTDFTAQLAQFSSLDELRNISQRLQESVDADLLMARAVNNTMAASLIGKSVRALSDKVIFSGSDPARLTVYLPQAASSLNVEILSDTGQVLRTLTFPNPASGDLEINWDGRNQQGILLPPGEYSIRLNARGFGGETIEAIPIYQGKILAVRFEEGNPVLVVADRTIPFGSVFEISDSQDNPNLISRIIRSVGLR